MFLWLRNPPRRHHVLKDVVPPRLVPSPAWVHGQSPGTTREQWNGHISSNGPQAGHGYQGLRPQGGRKHATSETGISLRRL